jgi:hypothetical protein
MFSYLKNFLLVPLGPRNIEYAIYLVTVEEIYG